MGHSFRTTWNNGNFGPEMREDEGRGLEVALTFCHCGSPLLFPVVLSVPLRVSLSLLPPALSLS